MGQRVPRNPLSPSHQPTLTNLWPPHRAGSPTHRRTPAHGDALAITVLFARRARRRPLRKRPSPKVGSTRRSRPSRRTASTSDRTPIARGDTAAVNTRVVVADDSYLRPRGGQPPRRRRGRPRCRRRRRHVRRAGRLGRRARCPTSSSPTSACRRPAPTRASVPPPRFRHSHPDVGGRRAQPVRCPELRARRCSRMAPTGRAYLLKDRVAEADDLVAAVRPWPHGGSVIDSEGRRGTRRRAIDRRSSPIEWLTPRERQILGEMAQGKSNAAIAATLVSASGPSRSTSTRSSPSCT